MHHMTHIEWCGREGESKKCFVRMCLFCRCTCFPHTRVNRRASASTHTHTHTHICTRVTVWLYSCKAGVVNCALSSFFLVKSAELLVSRDRVKHRERGAERGRERYKSNFTVSKYEWRSKICERSRARMKKANKLKREEREKVLICLSHNVRQMWPLSLYTFTIAFQLHCRLFNCNWLEEEKRGRGEREREEEETFLSFARAGEKANLALSGSRWKDEEVLLITPFSGREKGERKDEHSCHPTEWETEAEKRKREKRRRRRARCSSSC